MDLDNVLSYNDLVRNMFDDLTAILAFQTRPAIIQVLRFKEHFIGRQ